MMEHYEHLAVGAIEELRFHLKMFAVQIKFTESVDDYDDIFRSGRALMAAVTSISEDSKLPSEVLNNIIRPLGESEVSDTFKLIENARMASLLPIALIGNPKLHFKNKTKLKYVRQDDLQLAEKFDLPLSDVTRFFPFDTCARENFFESLNIFGYLRAPHPIEEKTCIIIQDGLKRLENLKSEDREIWTFWHDWYEGIILGNHLPHEMQREVICLQNQAWNNGYKFVGPMIEEVRLRHVLNKQVLDLIDNFKMELNSRLAIGGNNPPESIYDKEFTESDPDILVEPLKSLYEETEAQNPSITKVKKATESLVAILTASLTWTGGKIDVSVTSAAKWAGPALLLWVSQNAAAIEAIISLAKRWISILGII